MYFVLQLIDAFGHKSNISLVFDFMETDLEVRFLKPLLFQYLKMVCESATLTGLYLPILERGDFYYVS